MSERKDPIHHRAARHIIRTAGVCDAWCRECRMYDRILPLGFLFGVLLFLIYFVTFAAPSEFPVAGLVHIPQNSDAKDIAYILKEHHVIHSQLLFEGLVSLWSRGRPVPAGEYFFPSDENVVTIARRFAHGDHELMPIKVTIAEGSTNKDIAALLTQKIPDFDTGAFLALAEPKEGTLFPDTYFFLPGEDPNLVMEAFENNFNAQISAPPVASGIAASGRPLSDILTMASILEKEAADTKSREAIAGILWHRIALGMPLQVDAVFPYILGKNSFQLTRTDLATTSPYNTYTHKGLPPGPIANPSIDSILAAVMPTKSNYLYYLSDLQGNLHYCVTYACQLANEKKYLGS